MYVLPYRPPPQLHPIFSFVQGILTNKFNAIAHNWRYIKTRIRNTTFSISFSLPQVIRIIRFLAWKGTWSSDISMCITVVLLCECTRDGGFLIGRIEKKSIYIFIYICQLRLKKIRILRGSVSELRFLIKKFPNWSLQNLSLSRCCNLFRPC